MKRKIVQNENATAFENANAICGDSTGVSTPQSVKATKVDHQSSGEMLSIHAFRSFNFYVKTETHMCGQTIRFFEFTYYTYPHLVSSCIDNETPSDRISNSVHWIAFLWSIRTQSLSNQNVWNLLIKVMCYELSRILFSLVGIFTPGGIISIIYVIPSNMEFLRLCSLLFAKFTSQTLLSA